MTVHGLKSLEKELQSLKDDVMDAAEDAVSDTLDDTEQRAKQRLIQEDAVHTTQTYRGFLQSHLDLPSGFRKTLTNTTPHSKFVEWGTGQQFGTSRYTTMPPQQFDAPDMSVQLVSNIARWVETKPSFRREGPPRSLAYPISLAIAGHVDGHPSGTPPQPFMRPAWQRSKRLLEPKLRRNLWRKL